MSLIYFTPIFCFYRLDNGRKLEVSSGYRNGKLASNGFDENLKVIAIPNSKKLKIKALINFQFHVSKQGLFVSTKNIKKSKHIKWPLFSVLEVQ